MESEQLSSMQISNRTGSRWQTINYDPEEARKEKERLRRLELEHYQVELPTRYCSGLTERALEQLGETLLQMYEQVQNLINASTKMLETMSAGIEQADEAASHY